MEDFHVRNFTIKSHKIKYDVEFDNNILNTNKLASLGTHYIVDRNVLPLIEASIDSTKILTIDANENVKSYLGIEPIINELLDKNLKRDSKLVAIGGGITQDIACFIATTFMRGIEWTFVPTTLLAQSDSCIGSKSSINFGKFKNLLGSFTPPNKVVISNEFLNTLHEREIKSGIGEIVKLFFIDNKFVNYLDIRNSLDINIFNALQIKKKFIEIDEFDKGIRNILNYGHCFGHAIESASNFDIPHGIAVSIGINIANNFALNLNLITIDQYKTMNTVLEHIYEEYKTTILSLDDIHAALRKDKKNTGNTINIILPVNNGIEKRGFETSYEFWQNIDAAIKSTLVKID